MRILYVTHYFPYPPDDGGRIVCFNSIKHLSKDHEIFLVAQAASGDLGYVDQLKRYCADIVTFVPANRAPASALWRGIFGRPPGTAAKYWYPEFGQLVARAIANFNPHIVEFQHLNTAIYRPFAGSVPAILREQNVESQVWERHAVNVHRLSEKAYVKFCAPRVRAFEAEMATSFDQCIMVSEADARTLKGMAPAANVRTVPFGVDTEYFSSDSSVPVEPFSMVHIGSFGWKPKQHNLRIILSRIFPRIRAQVSEAKLHVVGKDVPEDIMREFGNAPGVTITGRVDDVRPYLQRASLMVHYLESGGGIAIKVLEAMSMSKAVLSNSLGCEGIGVQHGKNVFLAENEEKYISGAVLLLRDEQARAALASEGNLLVRSRYSWEVVAREMTGCYNELLSAARSNKAPIFESKMSGSGDLVASK